MKRWVGGLSIALGVLASWSVSAELVDSVAAMVDDEVILLSEIRGQVYSQMDELQQSGITKAEYTRQVSRLLHETLEESIETKILYGEAVRMGVEVHDSEVENRIDTLRATFDTEEAFMGFLDRAGESLSDYRKQQRKKIMAQYMSGTKMRELRKGIVIAEAEVTQYYTEHKQDYIQPEQIRIRQIMLRARRGTDERAQAIATLKQLRDSIVAGADFEAIANMDCLERFSDFGWSWFCWWNWLRTGCLFNLFGTSAEQNLFASSQHPGRTDRDQQQNDSRKEERVFHGDSFKNTSKLFRNLRERRSAVRELRGRDIQCIQQRQKHIGQRRPGRFGCAFEIPSLPVFGVFIIRSDLNRVVRVHG